MNKLDVLISGRLAATFSLVGALLFASIACTANAPFMGDLTSSGSSQADNGLIVTAEADRTEYRLNGKMNLTVSLVNKSPKTIYVFDDLGIGESASLSVDVTDAATGTFITPALLSDALPPPPASKDRYIRIDPPYLYGVNFDLKLADLGIVRPGKYKLVVSYHSPVTDKFTFGLPAWTKDMGVLKTSPIIFHVGDLK